MKGLKQYLKKHGKHFTVALAESSIPIKWNYSEVERAIKNEVWYNCWSATEGDMLYLINVAYQYSKKDKRTCMLFMLGTIGDYDEKEKWFDAFVLDNGNLDLNSYM